MSRPPRHIAIVGLMGSGKTTVGRLLAERLALPLLDSDDAIEERFGKTGRDLMEAEGLEALHHAEAEHLSEALAGSSPSVIAPAASVFDREKSVDALRRHTWVVWLDIEPHVLASRMQPEDHRRSIGLDETQQLLTRRQLAFRAVADLVISDAGLAAEDVVARIVEAFASDGPDE